VNISSVHLEYKKTIGSLAGKPVVELATTGGLCLIVVPSATGVETLGAGPHRAVARHIAKKRNPDLKITELAKSDDVPYEHFSRMVPDWERTTDLIRSRE
jgi:hypothetical protein